MPLAFDNLDQADSPDMTDTLGPGATLPAPGAAMPGGGNFDNPDNPDSPEFTGPAVAPSVPPASFTAAPVSFAPPAPITLATLSAQIDANTRLLTALAQQVLLLSQQVLTLSHNTPILQQIQELLMAYIPASGATLPKVPITATVTLTSPTGDTRYPVSITAATTITLPAADGSGKKLYFDFDSLAGFTPAFALNGTDTFVTPLPAIVQGETFGLVSDAAGKWSIE